MRNFYIRLAVSNIKKNKPVYYPFFLTNILSVMIFFCLASIQNQAIIATLPGSYIFVQFLKVGVVMTGMFVGVFLLYTNGLLIRQRKKELGLYTIFGLEKKHIAKVLMLESLLLTTAGLPVWRGFGKAVFPYFAETAALGQRACISIFNESSYADKYLFYNYWRPYFVL